jgi:hypothetical protein
LPNVIFEASGADCKTFKEMSYNMAMRLVQARLDEESANRLRTLSQRYGWTPSQVVREAIRVLALRHDNERPGGITGIGQFKSGVTDLGSNKKHLKHFGK